LINYEHFTLDNGLRVYVLPDPSVAVAVMNIAYDVGSRDEEPHKTGFAHLFEHLMFGGSKNIPSYDEPLQRVGGENNAFTSADYTNYYLTLPATNLETGFWLESDRMLSLSFDPQVLAVQRKVVIEEFKQRYLNRPYGDVWHKLRPVAYQKHPYRWPVIGEKIAHIEEATMEDVKSFFFRHYVPARAVLVVAGNVTTPQVRALSEKWFGPITNTSAYVRNIPAEPIQNEKRTVSASGDVPHKAIYKVYHMPGRTDPDYYTADLLSDVLGRGKSSRLYQKLVDEKQLFTGLSAMVTGTSDPGLLTINGHLMSGVSFEQAEEEIDAIVNDFVEKGVLDKELEKVKNQALATLSFGKVELLEKAMMLAYFALNGLEDRLNNEDQLIKNIQPKDLKNMAEKLLIPERSTVLYYDTKDKE